MIMSLKQRKIKFKPRIKLNHNINIEKKQISTLSFLRYARRNSRIRRRRRSSPFFGNCWQKKLAELNVDSFTIFECTTKAYYYFFLAWTNLCVEDCNKCSINMSECWRGCLSSHDWLTQHTSATKPGTKSL